MKHLFATLVIFGSLNVLAQDTEQTLNQETVDLYAARLGLTITDLAAPKDERLLTKLIQRHIIAIPFENLEMHVTPARSISSNCDAVIAKLFKGTLGKNRGGYCYEINELFYRLLKTLGFEVIRAKAAVWAGKDEGVIPHPSHQFSIVKIDEELFLADVAFGLFTLFETVKLPKVPGQEIILNNNVSFKCVMFDRHVSPEQHGQMGFIYSRWSKRTQKFERISTFTLKSYLPKDYVSHNEYVQTQYRPFLENIFFTRFNTHGTMITCVKERDKFSDMDAIVAWINSEQDDQFIIQVNE